jgi:hypothetical protein
MVRTEYTQGNVLLICAASQCLNIHIWENFKPVTMIFNAHIKTITDLCWISLKNQQTEKFD